MRLTTDETVLAVLQEIEQAIASESPNLLPLRTLHSISVDLLRTSTAQEDTE